MQETQKTGTPACPIKQCPLTLTAPKKKEEERMSITTHYLKVATHNRAASFQLHELTVSNATIQELN